MVAPAVAAWAAPAIGAAVGGLFGLRGAKDSAKQSQQNAREQMAFQERMSSTAYQRAATDLKAAGLNRIIALGSPASSPSGAMGAVPDYGSAITGGMNAGTNIAATTSAINVQNTTIERLVSDTKLLDTRNMIELQKSAIWNQIAPIIEKAGKDFSKLMNYMQGPMLSDLMYNIGGQGTGIAKALDTLLSDIYGSRYNNSDNPIVITIKDEAGM